MLSFPSFKASSINCIYISVLPDPVTPNNKNSSYSLSAPGPGASPNLFNSQDTIFIPSYGELRSSNPASMDRSTVYEFYKVASNVSKNMSYWTRTGWVHVNTGYGFYSSDGNSISPNSLCGVAPAGCL